MSKSTLDSSLAESSPQDNSEPIIEYCVLYKQPSKSLESEIKMTQELPPKQNRTIKDLLILAKKAL